MRMIILIAVLLFSVPASAVECPTGDACKVLFLTSQEEQALVGANAILQTALQGRPLDLANVVTYFRDKIAAAEHGTPKATPKEQVKDGATNPSPKPDTK